MRVARILVGAFCLSLATSHANAENATKTMAAGTVLKMGAYMNLNEDCSLIGYADVRIVTAPTHGTVKVYKGTWHPNSASSNPRAACNLHKAPSVNVDYTPERGYLGIDFVSIEVIFPNGVDRTDNITINVK